MYQGCPWAGVVVEECVGSSEGKELRREQSDSGGVALSTRGVRGLVFVIHHGSNMDPFPTKG